MLFTKSLIVAVSALIFGSTATPVVLSRRDHIAGLNRTNNQGQNFTGPVISMIFDGTVKLCENESAVGHCVSMFIADEGTNNRPTCNVINIPGHPDVRSLYVVAPLMANFTCRFFRADQEKICDHSVDYIEISRKTGDGTIQQVLQSLDLPNGNWTNNVGQVLCMGTHKTSPTAPAPAPAPMPVPMPVPVVPTM